MFRTTHRVTLRVTPCPTAPRSPLRKVRSMQCAASAWPPALPTEASRSNRASSAACSFTMASTPSRAAFAACLHPLARTLTLPRNPRPSPSPATSRRNTARSYARTRRSKQISWSDFRFCVSTSFFSCLTCFPNITQRRMVFE